MELEISTFFDGESVEMTASLIKEFQLDIVSGEHIIHGNVYAMGNLMDGEMEHWCDGINIEFLDEDGNPADALSLSPKANLSKEASVWLEKLYDQINANDLITEQLWSASYND